MNWYERHTQAIGNPQGAERGIVELLTGWVTYADRHFAENGKGLSGDAILGPAWARVGSALRTLLNGDCGRLDCGTIDSMIHDTLTKHGYDPDIEDWE